METVIVTFESEGAVAGVSPGATVLEAARAAGVRVDAPCGGAGLCAGCAVIAVGDLAPPTRDEERLLSPEQLARGMRLACRARVMGETSVRPLGASGAVEVRSAAAATAAGFAVDPPNTRGLPCTGRALGAAIDLGTTTIALSLVDLRNGDELAVRSTGNPQSAWGADVLSRISHALAGGAAELRAAAASAISAELRGMLEEAGAGSGELCEAALAGNMAMTHLLLGMDTSPLAGAPYEGAHLDAVVRDLASAGIEDAGDADLYVLPAISAFVGGDVVAGLLATRFDEGDAVALYIDLGTNGEMVLRTSEGMIAASAAAGPAFEGGAITSGMRAEFGAIERVSSQDGELAFGTIGGGEPAGLCGSGLVDLVAVLLDRGALDAEGRLTAAGPLASRVGPYDDQVAFTVVADVTLTQKDVRALQLAKGAVRAGVRLLLDAAGVDEDDVREVLLAGGFGGALDATALVRIGLIPPAWGPRVRAVGNAAGAGATAALVSSAARERAAAIARATATLELASDPAFEETFIGSLTFPAG